ncbi:GHKL domain-containing protein [Enterococcus sp. HY326]|uniref:GHKL domain-containing protein n=1 Tax=Enterococcus sp. HY326 TaxID=2971265 RepID=UPI0022406A1B|nr:GHKL domain-containing protein [Enterococcus sp. HY326]
MDYPNLFRLMIVSHLWLLLQCDHERLLPKKKTAILAVMLAVVFLTSFISIFLSLLVLYLYFILKFYLIRTSFNTWLVSAYSSLRSGLIYSIVWLVTYSISRIFFGSNIHDGDTHWPIFIPLHLVLLVLLTLISNKVHKKYQLTQRFIAIKKKYLQYSIISSVAYVTLFAINQYYIYRMTFSAIVLSFALMIVTALLLTAFTIVFTTFSTNDPKSDYLDSSIVSINKSYSELQNFRHDYKNILISLSQYLENDDLESAKDYLAKIVVYSNKIIDSKYYSVMNLNNYPLQALIISFINRLELVKEVSELNLKIEKINQEFTVEVIDLVRCLSILLDNAYEAIQPNGYTAIWLKIFRSKNVIVFEVKNTIHEKVSLEKIFRKNFTTKINHSGRGLYSLNHIIADYTNLDFKIEISADTFSAKIIMSV